jgi:hypothetical protein
MIKILVLDYHEFAEILRKSIISKFNDCHFRFYQFEKLAQYQKFITNNKNNIDIFLIDKSRSIDGADEFVKLIRSKFESEYILILTYWHHNPNIEYMFNKSLCTY